MALTMSPNAEKRKEQKQANETLVKSSNGTVVPVTGQERYLSVASSHFVAWCRAVLASCNTTEGKVLSMDRILAGKGQGDPFRVLCQQGWTFTILDGQLEEVLPGKASWIQMTMNSVHSNLKQITEMECLAHMAKYVSFGHTISSAKDLVMSSQPKCAHYLDTMAQYLQLYGGGSDHQFPFV